MPALVTSSNLARHDEIYEALVKLHEGLDETASHKTSWRLILLLANHIGDDNVIREAIALSRRSDGHRPAELN